MVSDVGDLRSSVFIGDLILFFFSFVFLWGFMSITTDPATDAQLRWWGGEVVWLPQFPSSLPGALVNPAGVALTRPIVCCWESRWPS